MNISRVSHTTANSKCHQWLTREIFLTCRNFWWGGGRKRCPGWECVSDETLMFMVWKANLFSSFSQWFFIV